MAVEQQTRQRSPLRKIREQIMAVILETKATKDEILELYLNDVYLGHRGSFALHGVPEAAKMFFSKDVRNLSLSEAALIAGVIQSPYNHSPFNNPERAKERRNVVLRAMADADYITADAAERALDGAGGGGRRARSTTRRRTSSTTWPGCSTPISPASPPRPACWTSTPRSISTCSATRTTR